MFIGKRLLQALFILFLNGCIISVMTDEKNTQSSEKQSQGFGKRLVEFRRKRALTQQQLSELISVHISQLRNYENDRSQPTLEVIRRLALALDVSADELVFDRIERQPMVSDKELKRQWEKIETFSEDRKLAVKMLLKAMIVEQNVAQSYG
jgi:transcriptional regulator with XRE-family HTH domain